MGSHILYPLIFSCLLFYGLLFCASGFTSTRFVKDTQRKLICTSVLVPLTSSPVSYLECARKCQHQPDCTAFMFSPENSISPSATSDARSGTCLWCPADSIVNISYTPADPQLETWVNIQGYLMSPPTTGESMAIPGGLSVGRFVVFQGRVPEPAPRRSLLTLFVNDTDNVAVRVSPRFDFDGHVNRLLINSRIDSQWKTQVFPEGFFPFSPGQNFEIAVLATTGGFTVYIDGEFIKTVTRTAHMAGDVRYASIEDFEMFFVTA
ncbi:receptor-type tyrosine-protein phosphatase delta [Plakobranchus ocellatus]|uniref:Galectin n=1 Tax=Plakobranchus ocellatus TaxID=259542 RepID=A0AAV3Y3Z6_9GAST|nr:receptor-type tyrosine-protein phosphatase delta [Plakobranchus ocellatus]